MPYELGALIDSTRTITVHSATPSDEASAGATHSAVALRPVVARDRSRSRAFRGTSVAMQHVRHAGLLQVDDVIEVEGRPVAIAPLPPGAPLSRLLLVPKRSERRFETKPAMRVALEVARAVQVLHAARPDLRPLGYLSADTVWITTDARAILLPSVHCAPVKVAAAKVPPWSRYRAPECGGVAVAGESSDVYSLGVLLWELLAAARPAQREMGRRAWIDPEVVRLVMRARSTDIRTRPRDPGAFAAELANALLRLGEGAPRRELPSLLAVEDGDQTVPGFVPFHLPDGDEEKTVPGFVPPALPAPDVDDDAATVELPLRAIAPRAHLPKPGACVGFAVLPPPVRAASEAATHGPQPLPAVPRPVRAVTKPSSAKLKVVTCTEAPASGELWLTNEPRRWVVGRAASAHLVVADPDMSREHFAVMWEGEGRYRVRDLGSKNGLFVNGKAATDSQLTPGDEVRAGGTRLRFEA
jgi:hypothetical protein